VTIPIGFLGCWLGTVLSKDREEERSFNELKVRSETGIGSEGGPPEPTVRRRGRAAREREVVGTGTAR
jgi:cation/acetate symporter